jgi:glycosyltransferase involved in cell wall biosynthesis
MRIAQISPLYESVPPAGYGGTERIVSYLTEELVRRGHEVTLFASGDSVTSADLVSPCKKSLRLHGDGVDPLIYHYLEMEEVISRAKEFDLLHFHIDYLHYPFSNRNTYRHITTLHGRLDIPGLKSLYKKYHAVPLVSISNNQRTPVKDANWIGTVYHGLPKNLLTVNKKAGNYVAFLGRFSPEKRADHAIRIAREAGMPIKVAAKLDDADRAYFENEIEHLLHEPGVEFLGEINEEAKNDFLGNAAALLFPIDWPEPFGLVMIEAMACGTPVIAYNRGSVPEIIDEGKTGFIVQSIDEAVHALKHIQLLDRGKVREIFEQRFSVEEMTDNYEKIYHEMLEEKISRRYS